MRMFKTITAIIAAMAVSVTGGCVFPFSGTQTVPTVTVTVATTVSAAQNPVATVTVSSYNTNSPNFLPNFVAVVEKVRPSVVTVETDIGVGTGWIIDASGIIVTNNHVVEDGSDLTVHLADGRSFPSQSVKTDVFSDLAILRIGASGLPAASVGSSSRLKVGEPVAAIGNGLGEGIGMKGGWVSRLFVTVEFPDQSYYNLIETDTAINEGNSGGPLVNLAGEVVGITSAKMVELGVEGVGYAIGIDSAMLVIDQLIHNGVAQHPFLGIGPPMEVTQYGISVGEVTQGNPAAQAGLKAGDIITAIDDVRVSTISELYSFIQLKTVGQRVKITYRRGEVQSEIFATLGARTIP